MKLYVTWFVGVLLFVAYCTANTIGYCMYGFTKYTHEDALVFALHDAASYSSWIIPEFRTLDDAREYLLQNPDCCGVSVGNNPVKTLELMERKCLKWKEQSARVFTSMTNTLRKTPEAKQEDLLSCTAGTKQLKDI